MKRKSLKPKRRKALEAEFSPPPPPPPLVYLWAVFRRLRRRKASNGFSIVPLEWPDIEAFQNALGFRFTDWELSVIEDLDDLFVDIKNETRPPSFQEDK